MTEEVLGPNDAMDLWEQQALQEEVRMSIRRRRIAALSR